MGGTAPQSLNYFLHQNMYILVVVWFRWFNGTSSLTTILGIAVLAFFLISLFTRRLLPCRSPCFHPTRLYCQALYKIKSHFDYDITQNIYLFIPRWIIQIQISEWCKQFPLWLKLTNGIFDKDLSCVLFAIFLEFRTVNKRCESYLYSIKAVFIIMIQTVR